MTNDQTSPFNFQKLSISAAEVIAAANKLLQTEPDNMQNDGLFIIQPASAWMQQANNRPIQQMLFAEFWFEAEICILFADTNLGKSILAVQIGDSISSGIPIAGFNLQAQAQPILYFDFELTDKQFENRYSVNYTQHHTFNTNFLRIEFNPDAVLPDALPYEDYLSHCLEQAIIEKQAKVLIIDNLTYLKNETEKAKDALPLMKHLKTLKTKYNLSILVLAHTPKRDLCKPITRNDLSGSKMLINFCDSAFAIGESFKDKSVRYLKQIKQRNTEQIYGADNVCICQISKPGSFLQFELIGFGSEWHHLKQATDADAKELQQKVAELSKTGMSLRQIARELGISHTKAGYLMKKTEL